MKKIPHRIVIYAKDIEKITGRSSSTACRLLKKIKQFYNKSRGDMLTVREFCEFLKLEEDLVREFLSN